jgi:hypothetical protein
MTDPIAGPGIEESEFAAGRGQKVVVIHVLEPDLQGVVVNIGHRSFGLHPRYIQGFVLEHGHLAGSVVHQGIVDAYPDFRAWSELSGHQVVFEYFMDKIGHCFLLQFFCLQAKKLFFVEDVVICLFG